MSGKKLSVVIPCYKSAEYLPRCLDSLLGQISGDIELVCVNDGSPDNCLEILESYRQKYPDAIIVLDKKNEGVWKARRDGIAASSGEYIGFIDSDDYVAADYAEKLYSAAKAADADVSICGFYRIDEESGKKLSQEMCTPRSGFCVNDSPGRLAEINGAQWNKIFKASVLKKVSDLSKPPRVLEDLLFQMLVFLESANSVVFVAEPLVYYFIHCSSAMNSISVETVEEAKQAFVETRKIYLVEGAEHGKLQSLDTVAFLHLGVSMVFRLSYNKDLKLSAVIKDMTSFLDTEFPLWRDSPYMRFSYAREQGGVFSRLFVVRKMYQLHLMRPFLACYRFMIDKLKIDIKW